MKQQKSYQVELEFIKEAVKSAINELLTQDLKHVERKEAFDLVTEIDFSIEKYLIAKINQRFPEDTILSEEFNPEAFVKGRTWTIDPIDGTVNFANSSPLFGVQCALLDEGEIVVGLIVLPRLGEIYTAVKGGGTFCNDVKVHVNSGFSLEQALVSVGDYQHSRPDQSSLQHRAIALLFPKIGRIRMYGSAAIDFSYVAGGKTAATIILTRNLWDIAPGIIIAKEAGAVITNPEGGEYSFKDYGVIVAANKIVSEEITSAFVKASLK